MEPRKDPLLTKLDTKPYEQYSQLLLDINAYGFIISDELGVCFDRWSTELANVHLILNLNTGQKTKNPFPGVLFKASAHYYVLVDYNDKKIRLFQGNNVQPKDTFSFPETKESFLNVCYFPKYHRLVLCSNQSVWINEQAAWVKMASAKNTIFAAAHKSANGDLILFMQGYRNVTRVSVDVNFPSGFIKKNETVIDCCLPAVHTHSSYFSTSPANSERWLFASHFASPLLCQKKTFEYYPVPDPSLSPFYRSTFHWLPDGTLFRTEQSRSDFYEGCRFHQIFIAEDDDKLMFETKSLDIGTKNSCAIVTPDGELFLVDREKKTYEKFEFKSVREFLEKSHSSNRDLKRTIASCGFFSSSISALIAEYSKSLTTESADSCFNLPLRSDISDLLREKLEKLHRELEYKISKNNFFEFNSTKQKNIRIKSALELFAKELNNSEKSLSDCFKEVEKNFKDEIKNLLGLIPELEFLRSNVPRTSRRT